jgi:PAS domain S-box-containing protein
VGDRERSAQALKESEERYRTVFRGAPIGMSVADATGRFVMTNRAYQRLLGYTEDELGRMHFTDVTHPSDLDVAVELFQQSMTGQRTGYEITKRYIRKDGQVVWANLTIVTLQDAAGNPQFDVGMVQVICDGERRLLSLGVEAVVSLVGEQAAAEHRVRLLGATDAWRATSIASLTRWEQAFEHKVSALRAQIIRGALDEVYREGRSLSFSEIADLTLALLDNYSANSTSQEPTPERETRRSVLSKREQEVLRLIARGLGNKTISKELGISPGTVSYHLSNIFNKLGVHSRAQAVAVGHQWLRPTDASFSD